MTYYWGGLTKVRASVLESPGSKWDVVSGKALGAEFGSPELSGPLGDVALPSRQCRVLQAR